MSLERQFESHRGRMVLFFRLVSSKVWINRTYRACLTGQKATLARSLLVAWVCFPLGTFLAIHVSISGMIDIDLNLVSKRV